MSIVCVHGHRLELRKYFNSKTKVELTSAIPIYYGHMVSPLQMPVPLKHMYNANILRADFTTSVPSYTPM